MRLEIVENCEKTVSKIAKTIAETYKPKFDCSLYNGDPGIVLFMYNAIKYGYSNDSAFLYKLLPDVIEKKEFLYGSHSLANGSAGVSWLIAYLNKQKAFGELIALPDVSQFKQVALKMLDEDYWDVLHGGIGVAYTALYCYGGSSKSINDTIYEINNELVRLISQNHNHQVMLHFDYDTKKLDPQKVNLSLAHGLPGILKYILECYKLSIGKDLCKSIADNIVNYLLNNKNDDTSRCYYPSLVYENNEIDQHSRIGWCYGDLGIGYMLFQAALVFENAELKTYSLEILRNTTKRRNFKSTFIVDAGICHGSAGTAHIYHRVWLATYDSVFKEAMEYWMQKTIDFATYAGENLIYEKYASEEVGYVNDQTFLEGSSGIGLALLSYATGDLSWDSSIMLNN